MVYESCQVWVVKVVTCGVRKFPDVDCEGCQVWCVKVARCEGFQVLGVKTAR